MNGILWRFRTRADDSCDGCGVWPLVTGPDDPFYDCCLAHDRAYLLHELDPDNSPPRAEVDRDFYDCCLEVAGSGTWLRWRAWLYYRIVRALGGFFW